MFWAGVTSGLGEAMSRERAENTRKAELQAERERKILEFLSTSDDPDIQSLALAGMMGTVADPKPKKGLRGFLGEVEMSPYLPQIQALLDTPKMVPSEVAPGVSARPIGGYAALPGMPTGGAAELFSPGSAAMPPASPVEPAAQGGGAGPSVAQLMGQPGQGRGDTGSSGSAPGFHEHVNVTGRMPASGGAMMPGQVGRGRSTTSPARVENKSERRRLFLSPEERIRRDTAAQIQGKAQAILESLRAAQSDEERRLIEGIAGAPRAMPSYAEGEIYEDPESPTGYSQILYNRNDPRDTQTIPAGPPRTGSQSLIRSVDESGTLHLIDPVTRQIVQSLSGVGKPYTPPTMMTPTWDAQGNVVSSVTSRRPGAVSPPIAEPGPATFTDEAAAARRVLQEAQNAARSLVTGGLDLGKYDQIIQERARQYPALQGKSVQEIKTIAEQGRKTGPGGPPAGPGGAQPKVDPNDPLGLRKK